MKITAEFNSNEELLSFANTFSSKAAIVEAGVKEITQKPIEKQQEKKVAAKPVEKPKQEEKVEDRPKPVEQPKEPEKTKITKEMVRAVFTKLVKAGKAKEAKDLTQKYGASRIPDIKEEDFEAIYKEAEDLI